MKNLNLQGVTNHSHFILPLEGSPEDLTNNYLLTSRDGKSIIAVTFREIYDELPICPSDENKKYVHFSISLFDKQVASSTKDHVDSPISLLKILEDSGEEEALNLLNSPPIGVVHGSEEDDGDEFVETLDVNSINSIVIGLKSGHLIKLRWSLPAVGHNEGPSEPLKDLNLNAAIIGSFDDGLVSMCRSPDEELVVAVSGGLQGNGQQVIVMSTEFDLLVERPLDPDFDGSENAVNVGWGSKETQFHGKAGKAAAKAKSDLTLSAVLDDGLVNIVWREDCQFFAISHISKRAPYEQTGELRRIRIFDRQNESAIEYSF